ncbi:signal transduction histidine kinase/CheY-like chemotaxis protein [Haloferula luteola]|uniref:histidine kinase n=1 Tax=Haloferula luteola TaxID=595692 RepID=A0A840VC34_9BACT|nr:ATP-binding protein [Haloferula luteola]MBB5350431.1 signal transduction histidine kinase/CheY-like chemotaxis protein [Haloferula luteola]
MTTPAAVRAAQPVRYYISLALCIGVTALIIWMRLALFHDRVFPLSAALPLLLCLWNRDLRVLYTMAIVLTGVTFLKYFGVIPERVYSAGYERTIISSQLINIWVVAGTIHALIRTRRKIIAQNQQLGELNGELEASNDELAASNEELSAREEEISRQNEELQCQTEELEQQAEELRQQTEEMEVQSRELKTAHDELLRRERGMKTLLESGRWLRADLSEAMVMNGICDAAIQILGESVHAACVVDDKDGRLHLAGDAGFGLHGAVTPDIPFPDTFAALIFESSRTAFIEDVHTRPDLRLPQPGAGRPFRSILASPIWQGGRPIAALEVFSPEPRKWSEEEFRIMEWLAAQAALALQSIRFQNQLDEKRLAAEEASLQKTRFLAAVSHDVRTPANAISLLAELIERCSKDPDRAHQIPGLAQNLWKNARSMIDLVSDVLDLTRFDVGRIDLELDDFSLNELVESQYRQALPLAEKKELKFTADFPCDEILVRSDRTKLSRVLGNLISNAIKFTERGEVRLHGERQKNGSIVLSVIDTGIGIPGDQIDSIFDEFHQLQNPERNRDKGAGLGLAICRRLVENLGFTLKVESLVGVGSNFSITLPASSLTLSHPSGRIVSPEPDRDAPSPLNGVRILLVEDHDTARQVTSELLATEGAFVHQAANGREALEKLVETDPEILLLDLNLPDFDGTEILKSLQVKRSDTLQSIFVVSGDVRPERIEEVKLLGADELIAKPVTVEKLRAALSEQRPDYSALN